MLRSLLGRGHIFGLIIIGEAFPEIIENLVLNSSQMQSFTLADWGFNQELGPSVAPRHSLSESTIPETVKLDIDETLKVGFRYDMSTRLHEVFTLRGWSTNVFEVTSSTEQQRLVAKLYWPNGDRPHEPVIIQRAREVPGLSNHLPRAFGHYLLWEEIRHPDLSLSNLMVRLEDGWHYGAINDWDLSDIDNQPKSCQELTITVRFTAIEPVAQLYYYELESFLWIIIWVFLGVQQSKNETGSKVATSLTGDPRVSRMERTFFLRVPDEYEMPGWGSYRETANRIADWIDAHYQTPERDETTSKRKELLQNLLAVVRGGGYTGNMPSTPVIDGF
ncbi:hypothetical protein B0J17DRAFT_634350 [Rhizoctonia solani]|nr:hypothetical protein B0J17DRAFT_634350 [Rhizoctonia solani]